MNLLINESPLQVLPSLAVKIGLNQALVLQQMHYWLRISKNIRGGHKWVYKTLEDWHKEFPFWSKSTLERIIRKLEEDQLIVVGNYNRMKMDRTKWYRVNYDAVDMATRSFQNEDMQHGEMMVSIDVTCEPPSQQNAENGISNLTTPITKDYTKNTPKNPSLDLQHAPMKTAFQFYEENGFGNLNSYVAEKIGFWIDDCNEELVIFAMKTAVENNVPKWNYVESVLRDWQQKQLTSVADAQAYKQSFKTKKQTPNTQRRTEIIPEWFHKRHETFTPVEAPPSFDFEAERLKILEKLRGPIKT
ncbi:DnaD domain protein [Lysinibacillus sp. NPDC097287]|uniref:DnaD domain protein n=1 Tax=Lysinibacillus sp. NPDC097287 TaxID=3364144 RepID=UPI00380DA01D